MRCSTAVPPHQLRRPRCPGRDPRRIKLMNPTARRPRSVEVTCRSVLCSAPVLPPRSVEKHEPSPDADRGLSPRRAEVVGMSPHRRCRAVAARGGGVAGRPPDRGGVDRTELPPPTAGRERSRVGGLHTRPRERWRRAHRPQVLASGEPASSAKPTDRWLGLPMPVWLVLITTAGVIFAAWLARPQPPEPAAPPVTCIGCQFDLDVDLDLDVTPVMPSPTPQAEGQTQPQPLGGSQKPPPLRVRYGSLRALLATGCLG